MGCFEAMEKPNYYKVPKYLMLPLSAMIVIIIIIIIDHYSTKTDDVNCEDIADDALDYYKKEVKPRYNTTEITPHLNNYLEKSREFYICMRNSINRTY
jgi:hypothetical protein